MRKKRRRQQKINEIMNMIEKHRGNYLIRHYHMKECGGRNRRWKMRLKALNMVGWQKELREFGKNLRAAAATGWRCEVTEDEE